MKAGSTIRGSQRVTVKDLNKAKKHGARRSRTRLELEVSRLAVNSPLLHVPL